MVDQVSSRRRVNVASAQPTFTNPYMAEGGREACEIRRKVWIRTRFDTSLDIEPDTTRNDSPNCTTTRSLTAKMRAGHVKQSKRRTIECTSELWVQHLRGDCIQHAARMQF